MSFVSPGSRLKPVTSPFAHRRHRTRLIDKINGLMASQGRGSNSLGLGTKTFTADTGIFIPLFSDVLMFAVGAADFSNDFMQGYATGYNSATGALTVKSTIFGGTGTYEEWEIFVFPSSLKGSLGNPAVLQAEPGDTSGTVFIDDDQHTMRLFIEPNAGDRQLTVDMNGNYTLTLRGNTTLSGNAGIERIAASTVTNADGEMFFPAGHTNYRDIEIRIFNLVPDVDNVSLFGHYSDDGTTWEADATDYAWYRNTMPFTTGNPTLIADASDPQMIMALNLGTNTNEILNGKIFIPDHNNASAFASFHWEFNHANSSTIRTRIEGHGVSLVASAVLGFRLTSNNADNDLSFDYEIWGYKSS